MSLASTPITAIATVPGDNSAPSQPVMRASSFSPKIRNGTIGIASTAAINSSCRTR